MCDHTEVDKRADPVKKKTKNHQTKTKKLSNIYFPTLTACLYQFTGPVCNIPDQHTGLLVAAAEAPCRNEGQSGENALCQCYCQFLFDVKTQP